MNEPQSTVVISDSWESDYNEFLLGLHEHEMPDDDGRAFRRRWMLEVLAAKEADL